MFKRNGIIVFDDKELTIADSTSLLRAHIKDILERTECVVYKGVANIWEAGNSTVTSSPAIDIFNIFSSTERIEVAVNLVSVQDISEEPLHYHSSHLIGVIVRGKGVLLTSKINNRQEAIEKTAVSVGDVVVIPRGANHIFQCNYSEELHYIALEFSDKAIDYQKHWKMPSE